MTTDYAGEWVYKGAITPRLDDWTRFPFASNDGNSIIRITCLAANPANIKSYGYMRVVYDVGNLNYSPWRRFWFSEQPQIINLGTPEEILINQTVIRYFEVKKTLRGGWRRRLGTVTDEAWVVQLEGLASTNLPADVLEAIGGGNPVKILNAGGSGNIVIVLTAQEIQNG
jgi:hypothetical protein